MDLLSDKPPRRCVRLLRRRVSIHMLRVLALLACSCAAFIIGALAYRGGVISAVKNALEPSTPVPTPLCAVETVDVPVLEIMMGDKSYRKLEAKRDEFLQGGLVMIHSDKDLVKAYVCLGDEATPLAAQVRLTGNMVDRVRDPKKWSFRIELDGTSTLLGMTRFNIQPPWARDYMSEWYYMQALRHEGLIASRYVFVRVRLNNQDLGIYGLEEVAGAPLLENNGRPASVVLRFEQDIFWQEWANFTDAVKTSGGTGSGSLDASNLKPYSAGAVADSVVASQGVTETDSPTLSQDFYVASALLESFRRGELSASQVFDIGLTARFFALTDLMGSWHSLNWNMMRFYYNPLTGLIEPVGLNGYNDYTGASILSVGILGTGVQSFSFPETQEFIALFFADEAFTRAYVSELERLSDPAWLDAFFADVETEARTSYSILALENPEASCSTEVFYSNAEYIRKVLNPDTKGVQAYFESYTPNNGEAEGATVTLKLANMQLLAVEVLDVTCGKDTLLPVDGADTTLAGRRGAMEYHSVTFACPAGMEWSADLQQKLTLAYHLLGTENTNRHESEVFAWPYSLSDELIGALQADYQSNVNEFAFLHVDETEKVIHILPGEWTITRTVTIPAGYELRCGPDTRLHLRDGACIVSYSPLRWVGDENAPIHLDGDGTGRGVLVLRAQGTSVLQHVVFDGLDAPTRNGIPLYGTVTFYESPSEWYGCEILGALGQDALHVVRTSAILQDVLIQAAAGNGLCAELATATLENVAFVRSGQSDLLAVTSSVKLSAATSDGAGWCAVLATEGSAVTVDNLVAQDDFIGLASVDRSTLEASNVTLRRSRYAVVAYQARSAWGGGEMALSALTLEDNAQDVLRETGSTISIDGAAYSQAENDVAAKLAQ